MLHSLLQRPRQSWLTLVGVMLIKFSTGSISSWGSINLYILSYLYYHGWDVSPSTNSMMIVVNIIPVSVLVLFATKVCDRFGYEVVIRTCALVYFLSPLVLYFKFNYFTIMLFGMLLPISAFAISTIPVINCLWTQFHDCKNKVTSVAVVCFAVGGAFWSYMFTKYVNPMNQTTHTVEIRGKQMDLFSREVAQEVLSCVKIGFVLLGSMCVIGSCLIKKNYNYRDSSAHEGTQMRQIRLSDPLLSIQDVKPNKKITLSLRQALTDSRFILIFILSLLSGVYQIFLNMNIKIIYMPLLNNDLFLVYCVVVSTALSIAGALFWGYFADSKGFYPALLVFTVLDCVVKILGSFARSEVTVMMLFIGLGFVDKAMITIIGPGLVKIFGIQTATQLLPYKGISVFLGFLMTPVGYIMLSSKISPFQYLFYLSFASLISIVLALKLIRSQNDNPK